MAVTGFAEAFGNTDPNAPKLSQERLESLYKRLGGEINSYGKVVFNKEFLKKRSVKLRGFGDKLFMPAMPGDKIKGFDTLNGDFPDANDYLRAGGKLSLMSPREYIDLVAKEHSKKSRIFFDELVEINPSNVEKQKLAIEKDLAPVLFLDTSKDYVAQEGLHRAKAAEELGLKKVPVILQTKPTPPSRPGQPKIPLFMPASEAGAGKGKVPKTGDMLTLDDKSLKLFLPSPGNPNASLSDFKGKNVQVLTTDLSMVGNKKIDGATVAFTGGPGYLSVNDAWGFTNEGSAKAFKTRWKRDDRPLIGLTSMKQDNHKASTLTREYYVRKFMQAINQGKIAESLVNEHIIEALTRAAKGKGLTDSQKRALLSVKNIEDFLRIFSNGQIIPWKATPKIYDRLSQATLPIKQGKLKELGLDLDTILRETRQKEYNDIKKGSLLAIAEYDGSDAVYRPDLNSAYPWSIPLKEKAFLKDFADIQDLSSRQDLRGSDGDANMAVAMGAGVMLDKLERGDVNFMPSGRSPRQPANRITRQAPAMPGNRFMLPAATAGAKSAERFR